MNQPDPFAPSTILATWFWSGLMPVAPGTAGSLAALPFAWAILAYAGWPWLLAAAAAVFAAGIPASNRLMARTGTHDPRMIVVDEVAGQWIALLPAALEPLPFAAGFLAFRLFDIWKPWPIGWVDRRVSGGIGVMLDDVIAGVYAGVVVYFVQRMLVGGPGA